MVAGVCIVCRVVPSMWITWYKWCGLFPLCFATSTERFIKRRWCLWLVFPHSNCKSLLLSDSSCFWRVYYLTLSSPSFVWQEISVSHCVSSEGIMSGSSQPISFFAIDIFAKLVSSILQALFEIIQVRYDIELLFPIFPNMFLFSFYAVLCCRAGFQ